MTRLAGRCAVVTGAGSGIGRASAIRFAREGARVLVVGRTQENIDETVGAIRADGGHAESWRADMEVDDEVAGAVARCLEAFGGLQVFFANAGMTDAGGPLVNQTVAEWERVYRGNTISAFLAVKHAGRHMTENGGGSIILTSSAGSLRANAGTIAYSAAKAAVNSLARGAANEFAGTGVRVNALLPGLVETKLTRATFEHARSRGIEDRIGRITPLRRAGLAEELAAAAAFLASDDSSFMTGQAMAVDGGVSSTHPYGRIVL